MRPSTLKPVSRLDVAGEIRAELARQQISSSQLKEMFGASDAYWSRRMTGKKAFEVHDLECVAEILGKHPAQLLGGAAPDGWTPPTCPEGDSNAWPTPYKAKGSPLALVGLAA